MRINAEGLDLRLHALVFTNNFKLSMRKTEGDAGGKRSQKETESKGKLKEKYRETRKRDYIRVDMGDKGDTCFSQY